MDIDFDFEESSLKKLDMRSRYLLTQIRSRSKSTWIEQKKLYEERDLEDLKSWFKQALEVYHKLPIKKIEKSLD